MHSKLRNTLLKGLKLLPSSGTLHGYENPEILDTVFRKSSVPSSVPWPEMAGAKSVLDFGGGCGHHYCRAAQTVPDVRWAVVETNAMVARARTLETDHLRFFDNVEKAADWLGTLDTFYSNGALQYTDDPLRYLDTLCALKAHRMIWERVAFSSGDEIERTLQTRLLAESGPGFSFTRKRVSYTITRIPKAAFLKAHEGYELIGACKFQLPANMM